MQQAFLTVLQGSLPAAGCQEGWGRSSAPPQSLQNTKAEEPWCVGQHAVQTCSQGQFFGMMGSELEFLFLGLFIFYM